MSSLGSQPRDGGTGSSSRELIVAWERSTSQRWRAGWWGAFSATRSTTRAKSGQFRRSRSCSWALRRHRPESDGPTESACGDLSTRGIASTRRPCLRPECAAFWHLPPGWILRFRRSRSGRCACGGGDDRGRTHLLQRGLGQLSLPCIDYVVAHELVHLENTEPRTLILANARARWRDRLASAEILGRVQNALVDEAAKAWQSVRTDGIFSQPSTQGTSSSVRSSTTGASLSFSEALFGGPRKSATSSNRFG